MSIFSKYPYLNFSDYNLDWCIETVKECLIKVGEMDDWRETHEAEYEALKKLVDDIYTGKLTPALETAIRTWLKDNAASIIETWVKMVFFGLTNAGYFVAYIPDSWDDITFKTTGLDIDLALEPDYGHLVLQY